MRSGLLQPDDEVVDFHAAGLEDKEEQQRLDKKALRNGDIVFDETKQQDLVTDEQIEEYLRNAEKGMYPE